MKRKENPRALLLQLTVRKDVAGPRKKLASLHQLRAWLDKLGALLELSDCELSMLLIGDKEMRSLNREWRAKDKTTDVLSFPQREPGAITSLLGDIVISVPVLLRQAKELKTTADEEFLRLIIHGLLHLLGYDHEGVSKGEAERMRRLEGKLFRQVIKS